MLRKILDLLLPPRRNARLLHERAAEFPSLLSPRHIGETVTLLSYTNPLVRTAILEAKYHGNEEAWQLLGGVLATYIRSLPAKGCVIVPVPLAPSRERARGYNQAERIARMACTEEMKLLPHALERVRDTLPQTKLSGTERRQNIRGAFRITVPLDPSATYLLIDDVTTTGATILEAAAALRAGGATQVLPIALAH